MNTISQAVDWLAGNGRYHTLIHCMGNDSFWIWTTVLLDAAVSVGYAMIAYHWWINQRNLPARAPARIALTNMRNIFVFCAVCGYVFIPVKMVWPAWRLYDMFLAVLVYFTWRYALSAKGLKVVYNELGRTKQLQEDLDASREESKRKSFFLNALSHDLRTPMNGLMLQASYAEINLQTGDVAATAESLREIKQCTRATADLLDSLLEYAKVDYSDIGNATSTFGLFTALDEIAMRVRRDADEKSLYLRIGPTRGMARIRTDRIKFERILVNLLNNAIKFTATGGVRIEVQRIGSSIEIHVIDSGVGIAAEARERLFEEFFQVHNDERDRKKGFGLGLTIARRLARQLGGDLVVESAVGSGSRFTLVLPDVLVDADDRSVGDQLAEDIVLIVSGPFHRGPSS